MPESITESEWNKVLNLMGIKKKIITHFLNGEDPTILFSKYDTATSITTIFLDDTEKIEMIYDRTASSRYQEAYELLMKYEYYYDDKYVPYTNTKEFRFLNHIEGMPVVYLTYNSFNKDMYEIRCGLGNTGYFEFKDIDNFKKIFINNLKFYLKSDGLFLCDTLQIKRLITLNEIL